MTTPWPAEVLDCAKRLAKSLGYEDNQIRVINSWVEVYREAEPPPSPYYRSGIWRVLDPRNPTVWSALIGFTGVRSIEVLYSNNFFTSNAKHQCHISKNLGIAVCESYNELKNNGRGKAKPPQKFSKEEICGFFKVPIDILR